MTNLHIIFRPRNLTNLQIIYFPPTQPALNIRERIFLENGWNSNKKIIKYSIKSFEVWNQMVIDHLFISRLFITDDQLSLLK